MLFLRGDLIHQPRQELLKMVYKEILVCSHFRDIYSFPFLFATLGPKGRRKERGRRTRRTNGWERHLVVQFLGLTMDLNFRIKS